MTFRNQPDEDLSGARLTATAEQPVAGHRILPADLGLALRYATDEELEKLRDAVGYEMKRRDMPARAEAPASRAKRMSDPEKSAHDLTRSQVSLVRASIRAGVKPGALAKQFGISLAAIRAVLAEK